jgi:hypothetical protein
MKLNTDIDSTDPIFLLCDESAPISLVTEELLTAYMAKMADQEEAWILHFDKNQPLLQSFNTLLQNPDQLKRIKVKYPSSIKEIAVVLFSLDSFLVKPKFIFINSLLKFWKQKFDDKFIATAHYLFTLMVTTLSHSLKSTKVILTSAIIPTALENKQNVNLSYVFTAIKRFPKAILVQWQSDKPTAQSWRLVQGYDLKSGELKIEKIKYSDEFLAQLCYRISARTEVTSQENRELAENLS